MCPLLMFNLRTLNPKPLLVTKASARSRKDMEINDFKEGGKELTESERLRSIKRGQLEEL